MKIKQFNLALISSLLVYSSVSIAEDSPTAIYSEDIITDQVNADDWHFYKIDLETAAKLTVKLRKISDDVDLYVTRSKKPTNSDFLCAPQKLGNLIETCRLTNHTASTWYIGVHGKMDSQYQLGIETKDLDLTSQIHLK